MRNNLLRTEVQRQRAMMLTVSTSRIPGKFVQSSVSITESPGLSNDNIISHDLDKPEWSAAVSRRAQCRLERDSL